MNFMMTIGSLHRLSLIVQDIGTSVDLIQSLNEILLATVLFVSLLLAAGLSQRMPARFSAIAGILLLLLASLTGVLPWLWNIAGDTLDFLFSSDHDPDQYATGDPDDEENFIPIWAATTGIVLVIGALFRAIRD